MKSEIELIDEAFEFAFCVPIPKTRQKKAAFGEKLAKNYFKIIADNNYFYQMVEWPSEFSPGFDVVFLAYSREEVEKTQSCIEVDDLGFLDPWDIGPAKKCIIVEAKCTSKVGRLRTYLRYNHKLGYRQMSIKWIKAAINNCKQEWFGELVAQHLEAGTLERALIVRMVKKKSC